MTMIHKARNFLTRFTRTQKMRHFVVLFAIAFSVKLYAQAPVPQTITPKPQAVQPGQPLNLQVNPNLMAPNLQALQGNHPAADANEPALEPVKGKDGLIAKVNGVSIPLVAFSEKYDRFIEGFANRQQKVPNRIALRYRESIIKRLIEEELLKQETEKKKVKIEATAVDAEFAKYKEMFKDEERFKRYLETAKTSVEQIKENIISNLKFQALIKQNGQGVVGDDVVAKYYQENVDKYKVKEQVKASHVFLKLSKDAKPEEIQAAEAKAKSIYNEIKAGLAFEEAAKKYSEGPNKDKGGDLNYIVRGRMVKAFDDKAFSLNINEVSEPVKTEFGIHIIKVTDKKPERVKPLEEVKENIKVMLENRAIREARHQLVAQLVKDAKVERFLPEYKEEAPSIQNPLQLNKVDGHDNHDGHAH